MNDINYYMKLCFDNDIIVYPIINKRMKHQVEVRSKKDVITYEKELLNKKELNNALTKTYIYYGEKLKKI